MATDLYQDIKKQLLIFSASLITCIGAIATICWIFGYSRVLNITPSEWSITLASSLSFFVSGIALLFLLLAPRSYVKDLAASIVITIASWRIAEALATRPLGLNNVLAHILYTPTLELRAMSIFAAVSFFCASLAILIWPKERTWALRSIFVIILTTIVITIGFTGVIAYAIPVPGIGYRVSIIPIQFYTALLCAILGSTLLARLFQVDAYGRSKRIYWVVTFVPTLILLTTIFLGLILTISTRKAIDEIATSKNQMAIFIYRDKVERVRSLLQVLAHHAVYHQSTQDGWETEALIYFEKNRDLQEISEVDDQGIIKKQVVNPASTGVFFNAQDKNVVGYKDPSKPFYLDREHLHLLISVPIQENGILKGAMVAELDLKQLFNAIDDIIDHGYGFVIRVGTEEIFTSSRPQGAVIFTNTPMQTTFSDVTLEWEMFASDKTFEVRVERFSRLMIASFGLILSLAIGYLIFWKHAWQALAEKNQKTLRFIEDFSKTLNEPQEIPDAARKLLVLMNRIYTWDALVIWQWNPQKIALELKEIVYHGLVQFPHLQELLSSRPTCDRQNLGARVFLEKQPIIIPNLSTDDNFLCAKPAQTDGIQGTLAFPMFIEEQISGVIATFKRTPFIRELEPEILDLLPLIGLSFGQYLQRKEFQKLEREATAAIKYSAEAIFSLDTEGIVKSWNLGAEKMYGWTAEEIIGKNIFELTFPKNKDKEIEERKRILREGVQSIDWEGQRMRKDGTSMWVHISNSPIRDSTGKVIGSAAVARDITEQKKIVTELATSEEKYRMFIESTKEWIWELDAKGVYTYSNASAQEIVGFSPQELRNLEFAYLLTDDMKKTFPTEFAYYVDNKLGWLHRKLSIKTKEGKVRWIDTSGTPFFTSSGTLIGYRGINRDITDQVKIDQTKDEFISMVSHELRTPLTSIVGAIGLLTSEETLSPKAKDLIALANRNVTRLTRIVNDILDIQKIQLGKISLQPKLFPMSQLVREANASIQPMAKQMNITITEGTMVDNAFVKADYERVMQVLLNILSNAIKFSPPQGTVTVSMALHDNRIRISVADQGHGIPKEFQTKVFDKFAQAEQHDARTAGGTGLGLSICKELINLMGGTIDFMTEEGKGTIFYFELPTITDTTGTS